MINNNISLILIVTGAVTMLPILQFLFPAQILKALNKIEIRDEVGVFFARHWGILAFKKRSQTWGEFEEPGIKQLCRHIAYG